MADLRPDPVQALALLPLSEDQQIERQWLQHTLAWLKAVPLRERPARLRQLAEGIAADAGSRDRFRRIWTGAFAARVYSEAGLPEPISLFHAIEQRVKRRLLPRVQDDLDLYRALVAADLDPSDADWLTFLDDGLVELWRQLLVEPANDLRVAVRLLAVRAASLGLSYIVMQLMPHRYETESPFYELPDAAGRFAQEPENPRRMEELRQVLMRCRRSADAAHQRLEEQGVSTDLVFRLDLVMAQLERIEVLLRVHDGETDVRSFASSMALAFAEERGLRNLARNSVNRLARRIVAHAGKSGEHYIALSRPEWRAMGLGAVGAGAITAFTALFKYRSSEMGLAPLWTGIAHSLNYTVSFVSMQLLGWKLASKMPSMTAAALADAIDNTGPDRSEVDLTAAIARTQTIVTIGNLLGAMPMAMAIDALLVWKTGSPALSEEVARHGVESLHPWHSATAVFAALTGVSLWLSSLSGGWTANWMARNRLAGAIAQSGGSGSRVKLAAFVNEHLSGVAGYVALGLLLGLLPFLAIFAGVPLEVRHITLASASLAYDASGLAWRGLLDWRGLGWAAAGLTLTAVLNFTVSFALGLWLAVRARDVDAQSRRRLWAALLTELRRHPARFLWRHRSTGV